MNTEVFLTNGECLEPDRIDFKEGGWLFVAWDRPHCRPGQHAYYPPRKVERIVSTAEDV
jgi:hypothetical protein